MAGCSNPVLTGFTALMFAIILIGTFESFAMKDFFIQPVQQGSQIMKVTDEILGTLPENVRNEFTKLQQENIILKSKIDEMDKSYETRYNSRLGELEKRLSSLMEIKASNEDHEAPVAEPLIRQQQQQLPKQPKPSPPTAELKPPPPRPPPPPQQVVHQPITVTPPPAAPVIDNRKSQQNNVKQNEQEAEDDEEDDIINQRSLLTSVQTKQVTVLPPHKKHRPTPNNCSSWLKIYVYEFSEELSFNKIAADFLTECRTKGKCDSQYGGENLLAQFSLELILADFFKQSCTRTLDPEEADLFYVPFYNDIEYRYEGRPNEASKYGQAILDILEKRNTAAWEKEFKVTGKYWERKWGADHIITMSAPVTGLRHPKGTRGWGHYMIQLTPPIFLSVELTRSFIHEYPNCSSKNIVLPYPIPGRDWHNGVWRNKAEKLFLKDESIVVKGPVNPMKDLRSGQKGPKKRITVLNKPIFTYYSGGNHGCTNVRAAISKEVHGDPTCLGDAQRKDLGKQYKALNPREGFDMLRGPPRQVAMAGSKFCACPEGDSPSAKRQYDAILQGCIPAVVSNEAIFAYGVDMGGELDPEDFSVRVLEESVVEPTPEVGGLLAQLKRIPDKEVRRLQAGVYRAQHFYRYYAEVDGRVDGGHANWDPLVAGAFPDGGAPQMLLLELEKRANGKIAAACAIEKKEPHHYLRFQYCGKAEAAKEISNMKRQKSQKKAGSRDSIALERGIRAYEEGWISRRR